MSMCEEPIMKTKNITEKTAILIICCGQLERNNSRKFLSKVTGGTIPTTYHEIKYRVGLGQRFETLLGHPPPFLHTDHHFNSAAFLRRLNEKHAHKPAHLNHQQLLAN